jgi:hypothetical protein
MHLPQGTRPMKSIDTVHTQCAALEHQTAHGQPQPRMLEQRRRWWHDPVRGLLATGAALGLILALLQPVQARTFSCGAGDILCLIAAINAANANGQTNMILLAAGTYTLTAVHNGTEGDTTGLPVITSTLALQGAGAARTIIERDASALAFRLLKVASTGTLTLTGLTLRGGHPGFAPTGGPGGGIFNSGTLMLTDCVLTDNLGGGFSGGGGIFNSGILTLTNSTLTDNRAFFGGGIFNSGTGRLTTCTLAYNSISDGGGGGIFNRGTLTLTTCSLTNNSTFMSPGGGIFNRGTLTLTNSTLTDNRASGGSGGGIFNSGTLTFTNSTLAANVAVINGGGGGIANSGTLRLTNSTVTNNQLYSSGSGGISNDGGSVTLQNTILALNTIIYPVTQADDCGGVVTSLGHNLIGDASGCTISLQDSDVEGDPGLGALTDNGSPGNGHVPLLPGSPAIDAGNDAGCPMQDQLGQPRVNISGVGTSRCDIGAIEFQPQDNRPAIAAEATP